MPEEILPNVYDITCREEPSGKRYRVYLFDRDTPTLFDTAFNDTTDALFAGIEEIGVEPERLIITHGDGDHFEAFDKIVDEYDVETYVPTEAIANTKNAPDHRVSDGDTIGSFTAVYTPGHGDDHYSYIETDNGIAIMGDAVSGADQRGLPTGEFHIPPAVYSKNLNQAEESLDRLLEYEFDSALVFHGSSVLENADSKLDRYVNFPGKPS